MPRSHDTRKKEKERTLHEARCMVLRARMGITEENLDALSPTERSDAVMADIVHNNLKVKECLRYVQDLKQSEKMGDEICRCGQKRSCHLVDNSVENQDGEGREWDEDVDVLTFPGNTAGQIIFRDEYSGSRKPSWYLRLAEPEKDNFSDFFNLLDCWKLFGPYPNLAIAIIGGSKQFKLENKSLEKFSHGLVKVASSTDAWVITEGFNFGIPRLVGDVIREGQTLSYNDANCDSDNAQRRIRCIAITSWGSVKNRDNLIIQAKRRHVPHHGQHSLMNTATIGVTIKSGATPDPNTKLSLKVIADHLSEPVPMYTLQKATKNEVFLNPDHSHFIFVDNGSRGVNCKNDTRFMTILMNKLFNQNKTNLSATQSEPNTDASLSKDQDAKAGLSAAKSVPPTTANLSRTVLHEPVPSVVVIINGGVRLIGSVYFFIEMSVPVVICKNTGRAADIFAHAYEIMMDLRNASKVAHEDPKVPSRSESTFQVIRSKIIQEFFAKKDESTYITNVDQLTVNVFEAMRRDQMVTVFDLGSDLEFDSVILTAFFKIRTKIPPRAQLDLAWTWDRPDIADEKIVSVYSAEDIEKDSPNYFNNLMEKSLLNSKLGFVALLINRGFSMGSYLTADILLKLYEESFKNDKFVKKCYEEFARSTAVAKVVIRKSSSKTKLDPMMQTMTNLNKILKFISNLISYQIPELKVDGITDSTETSEKEQRQGVIQFLPLENPYRELFIWALLFQKFDMANFFWRKMDHPVMTALMGSYLLKALMDRTSVHDGDRLEAIAQAKDQLEQLATDVLNKCGFMDSHMTSILLRQRHDLWDGFTCMDAAAQADCKKILGSHMCQDVLNERWQMKIRSSWPVITIGIIFFPLIPLIIQFDFGESMSSSIVRKINQLSKLYKWSRVDDAIAPPVDASKVVKSHATSKAEKRSNRLKHQFTTFYRAPITKFCFSTITDLLFLSLYTYFLLFAYHEQSYDVDRPLEILLHVWVLTLLLEICRAIAQAPNRSLSAKFAWWCRLIFNCTDGIALILYIIAFILRMIAKSGLYEDNFEEINFAAKTIFAFALFLYFVHLFNLLNVSTSLGPQLVMVGKMCQELGNYLFLLFLAYLAFGIYHAAILFGDNVYPEWLNFKLLVANPFWAFVLGPDLTEVFNADIREGTQIDQCSDNNCSSSENTDNALINIFDTNSSLISRQIRSTNLTSIFTNDSFLPSNTTKLASTYTLDDPNAPNQFAPSWHLSAWLAFWVLISFTLMNLLIAIFSNVYNEINRNANEIWKFYQYQVITEFESRPVLPPPLSVLDLLWRIFASIHRCCRKNAATLKKKFKRQMKKSGYFEEDGVENGDVSDDFDQGRLLSLDPVLQFEREAQTAVYRDKKRSRFADSVNQLNEIHSQLATIADQVSRLSRLEAIAEQVVIETSAANNKDTNSKNKLKKEQASSLWHSVVGTMPVWNKETKQKPETKPLVPDSEKILEEIVQSEKTKNVSPSRFPGEKVQQLEQRVDSLAKRLGSMHRISMVLKDAIKSMPYLPQMQPVQPIQIQPSVEPGYHHHQYPAPHPPKEPAPRRPPEHRHAPSNKADQDALWLPVAGFGLANVPKPVARHNIVEDLKQQSQSETTKP